MTAATVLRGRAWKFGNNVDTDQVIPAKYAIYSFDEKKLGEHAMEGVPGNQGGWSQRIAAGDIIVAGSNFGCGSSREIAPIAIRGAGVSCVIADSFARIFFRNSINLGYPILQSPEASEAIEICTSGGSSDCNWARVFLTLSAVETVLALDCLRMVMPSAEWPLVRWTLLTFL